jgi:hypothetical protein
VSGETPEMEQRDSRQLEWQTPTRAKQWRKQSNGGSKTAENSQSSGDIAAGVKLETSDKQGNTKL